jgi:cytochrome-b5 reductase
MDWIRKMNNTPNISGTNGKLLNVTEEELAKHNQKTDCWIAISGYIHRCARDRMLFVNRREMFTFERCLGNVYNITDYLDYHPGGIDEIMKGAGIDATIIFQEIHAWVNIDAIE